ncbi:MAG: hypothetical protein ACOCRZ_06920 [Halothermotrichaceae bacterium]
MLKPPIQPMLLSSKKKPFNSSEYIFEIKWDGYRCLAFIENRNVFLQSRNKKDLTQYFPELIEISKYIKCSRIILDGEICYINKEGKPVFEVLQGRIGSSKNKQHINYPVSLIVWDILSYNNKDVYNMPLLKRRKILKKYVTANHSLQISSYIKTKGIELFKKVKKNGLEGITAKKISSPYQFKRSKFWYKIKVWNYTEAYIFGFTKNYSLIVGKKDENNNFINMGRVKSAVNKNMKEALFRYLPEIITVNSHYSKNSSAKDINWVKPVIKCEIRYTEITRHNTFRHGFITKVVL